MITTARFARDPAVLSPARWRLRFAKALPIRKEKRDADGGTSNGIAPKVLKWGDNDQGGMARTPAYMFIAKTAGRNTV